MPNQFPEEEEKSRDFGTSYDPPSTTDENSIGMSHETLLMVERQLGLTFSQHEFSIAGIMEAATQQKDNPVGEVAISTEEEKKSEQPAESRKEKQERRKKKFQQNAGSRRGKNLDEKELREKEQRLKDWNDNVNRKEEEYDLIVEKENQDFVSYYQGMKLVPDDEWDRFYGILKQPLDICFRINSVEKNFEKIRDQVQVLIEQMQQNPETKDKIPRLLKWYPNQLAYTFHELSRMEMRANPLLKTFHQFLVHETEMGRIFRQEAVSMIPVTLLQISPQHKVIDLCAAPGSKTIQIIEYLHAGCNQNPEGFVLANDTDSKRAYMLTHQARRLNSPALFITNNDARFIPNLKLDKDNNSLKFDRILCDVPCSGDGTLRKNYSLWKNFNAHLGHAIHPLQLDILERGFQMLKKGGRLVYSTCSFNPLENEAVVAAALSRHLKQIELVDVSQEVSPHLKYRPGLINWRVYHRGKTTKEPPMWYESYEKVPNWKRKVVKETMFTDPYTLFNNEPDRSEEMKHDPLNLKRCLRVFPHDDNQGGFFVAVFTKIMDKEEGFIHDQMYQMNAWDDARVKQKPILQDLRDFAEEYEQTLKDYEEKNGVPKGESTQNEILKMVVEAEEAQAKKLQASGLEYGQLTTQMEDKKEEQFTFERLLDKKMDIWINLAEYYGIQGDFPNEYLFYQKNTNNCIVFISEGLTQLMKCKRKYKLNVVNLGVKLFQKNRDDKSNAKYRLLQEGLEILMPYMSENRKIQVTRELFLTLLEKANLTFEELKNQYQSTVFEGRDLGSAVMIYGQHCATIWIGVNNVSLMINKEEIKSFKFLMTTTE